MDIDRYLNRIRCVRPRRPDLEGLRAVHAAHLLAIPYENIDVQLGCKTTTSVEASYEKIVTRGRGGWCYEMNGLLGWALAELGFRVTRVTGSVGRKKFGDSHNGNHLVLRVDLEDGTYLADTGFGNGPLYPFKVAPGDFSDGRFTFALDRADGPWWRMTNWPTKADDTFDFMLAPADEAQFARMCTHLQTSPDSNFVKNFVVQHHTNDGVVIVRGRSFRHATPDETIDSVIGSADELVNLLGERFGLDVPEVAALWPRIVARHEELFGPTG